MDLPDIATVHWNDAGKPALSEAMTVAEPEILFSKIEDDAVQRQIDRLEAIARIFLNPKKTNPYNPLFPSRTLPVLIFVWSKLNPQKK